MAFELSLGRRGISTGGDGEGYSVPGMSGVEQSREVPTAVRTTGRKVGAWAVRQAVLSPLYFRGMIYYFQLNIEENELYC